MREQGGQSDERQGRGVKVLSRTWGVPNGSSGTTLPQTPRVRVRHSPTARMMHPACPGDLHLATTAKTRSQT